MGAFVVERAGTPVAARYGDVVEEHRATRAAVGVFDLSSAGKLHVRGPERTRFLDRLLSGPVAALAPGGGAYSLLLMRDARITSDLRVVVLDDEILLLTPSLTRSRVRTTLERHRVASQVELADATEAEALVAVQGPQAERVLADTLGVAVPAVDLYGSARVHSPLHGDALIVRSPRTGEEGWDVLVPAAAACAFFRALVGAARAAGGGPAGLDALDSLRVEMGTPAYGAEIDERTLPTEVEPMLRGVSFEKGCYLGHETIARLVREARPARRLVGLTMAGYAAPVRGDRLVLGKRTVGVVTTGAYSPAVDRPIALGLVATEHAHPETRLALADGGEAVVTRLPFVSRG